MAVTDVETRYRQRYLDLMANERSREIARAASRVVTAVRRFFEQRDFMEVATPVLQQSAGGAAARPFVTHHNALDRDLYLRISLELHLKRLLIGGFDRVFEIGRVFRNEGVSHRHNPEFTLLESYEAYADYRDVARMVEELLRSVAEEVAGTLQLQFGEHSIDLAAPFATTTFREALLEHGGLRLAGGARRLGGLDQHHPRGAARAGRLRLAGRARRRGAARARRGTRRARGAARLVGRRAGRALVGAGGAEAGAAHLGL